MPDPVFHHATETPPGLPLKALALAGAVFAASMLPLSMAQAQTDVSLILPLSDLRMTDAARSEVQATLHRMSDADLRLTYARLQATFRLHIGDDDLTLARALVDYALLAEAELTARQLPRPPGTEAARDLLMTYELIL